MNPDLNDLNGLLKKDIKGELTPQEVAYLRTMEKMYDPEEWERMVADAVFELAEEGYEPEGMGGGITGDIRPDRNAEVQLIADRVAAAKRRNSRRSFFYAAAGVLILISVGIYMYRDILLLGWNRSIDQVAKCEELAQAATMPLMEFGVQMGGSKGEGNLEERMIHPGESGVVDRQGSWEVTRNARGQFEITHPRTASSHLFSNWDDGAADKEEGIFRFRTVAQQQAEIKLPGGTTVRLNAGSALIYGAGVIGITGEAYIVVGPVPEGEERLRLETQHLSLTTASTQADYVVRTDDNQTGVILLGGRMSARSKATGRGWKIEQPRTYYQLDPPDPSIGGQVSELWLSNRLHSYERPLAWTEPIRYHPRVKLSHFITEMSRWYGIQVHGLDCLDDQWISARFCYRNSVDQFIAGLSKLGIEAQWIHGDLHFCKPHTGPPLADPIK